MDRQGFIKFNVRSCCQVMSNPGPGKTAQLILLYLFKVILISHKGITPPFISKEPFFRDPVRGFT